MHNQTAVIIALSVVAIVMLIAMIRDADIFPPLAVRAGVKRPLRPSQSARRIRAITNYTGATLALWLTIILIIPMYP